MPLPHIFNGKPNILIFHEIAIVSNTYPKMLGLSIGISSSWFRQTCTAWPFPVGNMDLPVIPINEVSGSYPRGVIGVCALLLIGACLTVALRLYARALVVHRLGWDDGFIFLALVCCSQPSRQLQFSLKLKFTGNIHSVGCAANIGHQTSGEPVFPDH